jgi:5-methylcytosine-specific restriction enzyme B
MAATVESDRSLDDALQSCNRQAFATEAAEAESIRGQLLELFPRTRWAEMVLEEFALGHDRSEDSYCRWIEFNSTALGSIKGGSAGKLIIFKRRDQPGWHYPPVFSDEQAAWTAVRAGFLQAFELADEGRWAEIDQIEALYRGPALKLKTTHLYFPDEILPVYSTAHLRHFLHRVGEHDKAKSSEPFFLNRSLLTALRSREAIADWSTKELERFLYTWADPREAKRVVKIAPGRDAAAWGDCLREGYICVGWGEVGDLTAFESKEAFRERFSEVYGDQYKQHRAQISKKANEVWTLTELEPGDIVVANHGTSKVLAVGQVNETGYAFRPEREDLQHTVGVNWDTAHEKDITPQKSWAMVTVAKVPDALMEEVLSGQVKPPPADPMHLRMAEAIERKGQMILYGPPGTGKTYNARRFAVWWLLRKSGSPDAERVLADKKQFEAKERELSTAQLERRVWWVVANPKEWSWDALFAEGSVEYRQGRIQRNYPLVQAGDWVVGYQSTPDKRIVALAKVVRELSSTDGGEPKIGLEPVCRVADGQTYEELAEDPVLRLSEPMRNRNQGTLFALTGDEAEHLLVALIERNPEVANVAGLYGGSGTTGVGPLTRVTFHPSYTYEDFIEGYRPTGEGEGLTLRLDDGVFKRVCREAQSHPEKTYLVLVDEINRGNVAKILGELLTLLELEKRGLTVTLPQSKETFSVPKNVFLLGTMNTADRSIKMLDTALRRRFAFIELMPDVELLRGIVVNDLAVDDFLEELNRRIASREGREKQIGHSYLLDEGHAVTDPDLFASRFREEILPLLQEYCYDEYARLADYIGDRLVDKENQQLDSELLANPEQLIAALAAEFGSATGLGE